MEISIPCCKYLNLFYLKHVCDNGGFELVKQMNFSFSNCILCTVGTESSVHQ